jgi:MoxR-like ATPase
MDGARIRYWQGVVRKIFNAPQVQDYAIRLILATHPQGPFAANVTNRFLRFGSSPRGAQAIVLAAKIRAMLDGRYNVSFEDIRKAYLPALRHRILLNFEAQAENIAPDTVLEEILADVKEKASDAATLVKPTAVKEKV